MQHFRFFLNKRAPDGASGKAQKKKQDYVALGGNNQEEITKKRNASIKSY